MKTENMSSTCGNCRKPFKIVSYEKLRVGSDPVCSAKCEKILHHNGDRHAVNVGEVEAHA